MPTIKYKSIAPIPIMTQFENNLHLKIWVNTTFSQPLQSSKDPMLLKHDTVFSVFPHVIEYMHIVSPRIALDH